jgi:hypothetical protein
MSFVIAQNDATDVQAVGGKAAALARLAANGFNPPTFFVIRAEAFETTGPVDGLDEALAMLGPGPFAVRSSARAEDGADHSHAGQFDTHLNVAAQDVWTAAQKVWRSGFSDTVATYRAVKTGGDAEGPAVIVQRMIDATAAGVAFSADPVSGQRGKVVISAIAGLGEALVSGEEDGESWVVATLPIGPATPDVLTQDQAMEIASLARRAEATFGVPQDIEWAIDTDGLHILQSRPITTPLLPPPQADTALTIYDNSNIVESYPGMVSPLTYSFAVHVYTRVYRAFVSLLGVPEKTIEANAAVFGNMLGRVDGRVYYNLVNWYRALALLPGFSLNRAYMETMMGVSEPMPAEVTDHIGPPPARAGAASRIPETGKGGPQPDLAGDPPAPHPRAFYDGSTRRSRAASIQAQRAPRRWPPNTGGWKAPCLDRWDAPLVNDFLMHDRLRRLAQPVGEMVGAGGAAAAQRCHDRAGRHRLGRTGAAHRADGAHGVGGRGWEALAHDGLGALARPPRNRGGGAILSRPLRRPLH